MKRLIMILMIILMVSACEIPVEETSETIIEKQYIYDSIGFATDVKIFPNAEISRSLKDDDFEAGKMYVDNAYATDSIIHTLDLSSIIGSGKSALIALQISVISGCDNEYFNAKFKPYGMDVGYQTATAHLLDSETDSIIYIITDGQGRIQWYSDYGWPVEKYVDIEIWAIWYSIGTLIK